jgi:hypothetical protein
MVRPGEGSRLSPAVGMATPLVLIMDHAFGEWVGCVQRRPSALPEAFQPSDRRFPRVLSARVPWWTRTACPDMSGVEHSYVHLLAPPKRAVLGGNGMVKVAACRLSSRRCLEVY